LNVRRSLSVVVLAVVLAATVLVQSAAAGAPATYRLQLDAKPPSGESWSFLRMFPAQLTVHQGDVVDAAWAGAGSPHTATIVPDANANVWRDTNQGPGGPQDPGQYPYALEVPDQAVGGDDQQIDLNPAVAAPSDPTCGTSGNPCAFNGGGVVSSGLQFAAPGAQPNFFVQVTAAPGTYSFLCLLHPGMQIALNVVSSGTQIPTPDAVAKKAATQVAHAKTVDATVADDLAQTVKRTPVGNHERVTMWAGGFWKQVSADEFPDKTVRVHVGDHVRFLGNFEIHTATFPDTAAATVPFIMTQCEVPGPDTPATSPADCTSPTDFQIALNNQALFPTKKNDLSSPSAFRNSGLLAYGTDHAFVAEQPGLYHFVCLVHGPSMSGTIRVLP
jgi:plastocyanin